MGKKIIGAFHEIKDFIFLQMLYYCRNQFSGGKNFSKKWFFSYFLICMWILNNSVWLILTWKSPYVFTYLTYIQEVRYYKKRINLRQADRQTTIEPRKKISPDLHYNMPFIHGLHAACIANDGVQHNNIHGWRRRRQRQRRLCRHTSKTVVLRPVWCWCWGLVKVLLKQC